MPINGQLTFYELLGLPNFEPDPAKIKKAYRSLALKNHPDRNEDKVKAEETMKVINHIYEVLTKHKQEYDEKLKIVMGMKRQQTPVFFYTFGGSDNSSSVTGGWYYHAG